MEKKHLEEDNRLKIYNQRFLYESGLNQYIEFGALSKINFSGCNFQELNFLGKVINFCDFKNCTFNNLSFRKCKFSNCRFENCQIVESDLTRVEFNNCSFKNCNFLKINLTGSDFMERFDRSKIDYVLLINVKFWKLNDWIEIKKSPRFDFKKVLQEINAVSSNDSDEPKNS